MRLITGWLRWTHGGTTDVQARSTGKTDAKPT